MSKRKQQKKMEIEYEDAPSGFVTFYNYKEPLMKYDDGYGYVGALLFDGTTDKIQCHMCGDWFGQLAHHLAKEHNMRAAEYKARVGLMQNTALISESSREKLIASGLDKRLQNLRKGGKKTQAQKDQISATLKRSSQTAENKNIRGTCPAQLIDRMQKIYQQKGDKIRMRDFNNFDEVIRKTFGTLKEACEIAGIPYREPSQTLRHEEGKDRKYTQAIAVAFITEFIITFGKAPSYIDYMKQGKKGLWQSIVINKKNAIKLNKIAYTGLPQFKRSEQRITYSKEQLLDFLRKFEKINGRKPSYSDSKRGLLPYLSRYSYHFGSWKKALEAAFN